ncbi:hypothetical protein pb186bvf_013246 [Paramecium bursaria]
MMQEKKINLTRFQLKTGPIKAQLPPKFIQKIPDVRPMTAKVQIDYKSDLDYLLNDETSKQEWLIKCDRVLKDWAMIPDKNNQMREFIMKKVISLIDSQDPNMKILAIRASLYGFLTLNLLEIIFGKQQKTVLKRPRSGSKMAEQLPSVLLQPQQFLAILQKGAQISEEELFQNIIQNIQLNLVIFKILKLFSQLPKDQQTIQQLIPYLNPTITILKNISNNQMERSKILQQAYLLLIDQFLHTFPIEKQYEKELSNINIILMATLRNLSIDATSTDLYLQCGIINKIVQTMVNYSNNYDLILNTLRIMSQMSLSKDCCNIFMNNDDAIRNICFFFKIYQTNIYVIIRASYLLANMTTYFEGIRQLIYFKFNAFQDIYNCFEYFWTKELQPTKQMSLENFGQSHAAWDFQILKQEKNIDALIRIIRLIANLLTVEQIGLDLMQNNLPIYKTLISKLLKLLQKFSQIQQNAELISCTLCCLCNATFYEKQSLLNDFEFKNSKLELIPQLGHFIIQNEDQEICCDGLRVLSNLSRQKDLIKQIIKTRVAEGVIVLLDSNSQDVVYYSLGVLINLLVDQDFKLKEIQNIIEPTIQILADCTLNENDIANLSLKVLVLLIESGLLKPDQMRLVENAVQQYGKICDQVLQDQTNSTIINTRTLINQIVNQIPDLKYKCPNANCGRAFETEFGLKDHIKRRHQL